MRSESNREEPTRFRLVDKNHAAVAVRDTRPDSRRFQGQQRRSFMAAARFWSRFRDRRLAVVLSGGAATGAFQAGLIDVLARRGVRPDLIVGTSVGAIN